jgi:hypothetical protein
MAQRKSPRRELPRAARLSEDAPVVVPASMNIAHPDRVPFPHQYVAHAGPVLARLVLVAAVAHSPPPFNARALSGSALPE